jgi:hypothetical protein
LSLIGVFGLVYYFWDSYNKHTLRLEIGSGVA